MNHIATVEPSAPGENYTLLIMGDNNGDEDGGGDGFRGQFPIPAACRNRDFCPPNLDFAMAAALEVVIVATWENNHEDGAIDLDATPTMMEIMPVDDGDHIMASPINFNQFLEKEKLKSNGSNFTDWFRHVRIFLAGGNLQYVLDAPLGDPPAETETDEVKNVYATRKTRYSQVQCAILCSLEADLQKKFEHHDPHELVNELKAIFETHAAVECYEASKHFFSCMMEEGSSVSEHMLAMTGHAKKLSDLGIVIPNRLGINRVLQSLPPSYKNFVMNYNMQNMNKELPELFSMLKSAEIEIKKEHQVLMVNKTTSFKKQGKSKGKFNKGGKKAATPPVKPKNGPKPDAECYYCKEKGHWKRNCSKYLADLKSGLVKKKKEGISDIHVIDVYLTGSRTSTWVFDTGSVAHICNSKQELRNKRRLLKDEVTMRVGNGSKERDEPHSYRYSPEPRWRTTPSSWETAALKMAVVSMEEPSGGTSRPGGVPNRDSVPGSWLRDGGGSKVFSGFVERDRVFATEALSRRKGRSGPHEGPTQAGAPRPSRAALVSGHLVAPLRLPSGLSFV
ncbi:hypothetical protein QYE76_046831 [Lolium multiflorum]|uniref:CCHC-type domain-containing protein n=1 Tax=Lolium multiflorum TaxID=4521 RepID=A0AAD8X1F1_LOLMU|nr:hypothetical protein QYE76_046831 [Lolium multiflorum]